MPQLSSLTTWFISKCIFTLCFFKELRCLLILCTFGRRPNLLRISGHMIKTAWNRFFIYKLAWLSKKPHTRLLRYYHKNVIAKYTSFWRKKEQDVEIKRHFLFNLCTSHVVLNSKTETMRDDFGMKLQGPSAGRCDCWSIEAASSDDSQILQQHQRLVSLCSESEQRKSL